MSTYIYFEENQSPKVEFSNITHAFEWLEKNTDALIKHDGLAIGNVIIVDFSRKETAFVEVYQKVTLKLMY